MAYEMIPSNNDANTAKMPDDQPNAKEPSLSTKASTERRPILPLNTQPSTLVESEVAEKMVLARAKMKESESEMAEKMSSVRAKMSSVTSKLPEMVPTAIDEVARGKRARPYASDDAVSKLKAKSKRR